MLSRFLQFLLFLLVNQLLLKLFLLSELDSDVDFRLKSLRIILFLKVIHYFKHLLRVENSLSVFGTLETLLNQGKLSFSRCQFLGLVVLINVSVGPVRLTWVTFVWLWISVDQVVLFQHFHFEFLHFGVCRVLVCQFYQFKLVFSHFFTLVLYTHFL